MFRTIRIALARRTYNTAVSAHVAYQTQPADGFWTIGMALALHERMLTCERRLARAINS